MPPERHRLDGDTGTGLIGSTAGVLAFLAFVLFTMQLLIGLHTASTLDAVADEGAARVASAAVDHADPTAIGSARLDAEDHMRALLGRQATVTTFDWSGSSASEVVLRVRSEAPRFMLPGLQGGLATDHIERTARRRVEELR